MLILKVNNSNAKPFVFQLGMAMLAGMAVFVVVIPLNGYLMKLIEKADESRMDEKDKRIKLMNEILNGIKVWANMN